MFSELNDMLRDCEGRGVEFLPALTRNGIDIFDVKQRDKSKTEPRDKLEQEFSSLSDLLLRDRIYVPPQYLQIHVRHPRLSRELFYEGIGRVTKNLPEYITSVYRKFDSRQYDFLEALTLWASSLGLSTVEVGMRAEDNIIMKLKDDNYLIVKLVSNKVDKDYGVSFLIGKFSTNYNLKKYEELICDIASKLYDQGEGEN